MMITLAGAMSTGELGISWPKMIVGAKWTSSAVPGANLEEDVMNLVAHSHYKRVPATTVTSTPAGMGTARKPLQPRN